MKKPHHFFLGYIFLGAVEGFIVTLGAKDQSMPFHILTWIPVLIIGYGAVNYPLNPPIMMTEDEAKNLSSMRLEKEYFLGLYTISADEEAARKSFTIEKNIVSKNKKAAYLGTGFGLMWGALIGNYCILKLGLKNINQDENLDETCYYEPGECTSLIPSLW